MVPSQWDQITNLTIFFTHALTVKKKGRLDEAVKMIDFLNSQPLTTVLSTLLSDQMGSIHTEVQWLPREKALV